MEEIIHEDTNINTNTDTSNQNKKVKSDECMELKNIKYKTMLLNGNTFKETKSSNNLSNLAKFLKMRKTITKMNLGVNWIKL